MRLRTGLALVAALGAVGLVAVGASAHESAFGDASPLLWEEAYPAYASGGPAGEALEPVGEEAFAPDRTGGQPTPSRTHHDEAARRLPIFNCPNPTGPPASISSRTPVAAVDAEAGVVEATGAFELAFTVEGPASSDAAQVWMGIGHSAPAPAAAGLCGLDQPGAWSEGYRVDTSREDGFSTYLNSLPFPDGPYGLAVRALAEDGRTLATGFAYVEVDNYANDAEFQPGTPVECQTIENLCPYRDATPPYPHVEGAHGNAKTGDAAELCPDGIVLEYVEPLTAIEASAGDLEPIQRTEREVDILPLLQTARVDVGVTYCWTGAAAGERVQAVDQQGNVGVVPAELG